VNEKYVFVQRDIRSVQL